MKRDVRQQQILDILMAEREVDLDDLSARFGVSKMTIHRDLDEMEGDGLLRKIRGGATIETGKRFESDFRFRERQFPAAKSAIAKSAMDLIEPGMTVLINDGSTAAALSAGLVKCRPLTVITNNAAVIDALKDESGITLIGLGGVYSAKFNAYAGKITENTLANLRADLAFISSPAVSGTAAFHMDETMVGVKRAMMAAADRTCLLINATRFGQSALHKLADLAEFDTIITDADPDPESQQVITDAGVSLVIAG